LAALALALAVFAGDATVRSAHSSCVSVIQEILSWVVWFRVKCPSKI